MKADLLLNEDLRRDTEEAIQKCLDMAKRQWPKLDFPMPIIRYDVKNTIGGLAYTDKWMVRFNLVLMVENREHFIKTTVPHEVAHLVARLVHHHEPRLSKTGAPIRIRSHGKEWREIMVLFGVLPKSSHSYDLTSIQSKQRPPRKKSLNRTEIDFLVKRIQAASRRLPDEDKQELAIWLQNQVC
jgi:predicted SprT family Zn-dependent metalloprotease